VDECEPLVGGQDTRDVLSKSLRSNIGVVPQVGAQALSAPPRHPPQLNLRSLCSVDCRPMSW
jgi:hypothetical protein